MTELIRQWLGQRLQSLPDLSPNALGRSLQDGRLIARILLTYGVISEQQLDQINRSRDYYANASRLACWLQLIGVVCTDQQALELSNARTSTALAVIYDMYLALIDKDRANFITRDSKRRLHPYSTPKFEVQRVRNTLKPRPEITLAKPLHENRKFLKSCRDVEAEWQNLLRGVQGKLVMTPAEKCYRMPTESSGVVISKPKSAAARLNEDIAEFEQRLCDTDKICCAKRDTTDYYDLLKLQQDAEMEMLESCPDPTKVGPFVMDVKRRKRLENARQVLRCRIKSWIEEDVFHKLDLKTKISADSVIVDAMQQQTEYEKRMSASLLETQVARTADYEYATNFQEDMIGASTDSIQMTLDLKVDKDNLNETVRLEKERNWELHRRLYEEKQRKRHAENTAECKKAVEAILELAFRVSEYRAEFETEAPPDTFSEWCSLFVRGLPILDTVEHPEELLDDTEEIIDLEAERQDTMNDRDFTDYYDRKNIWNLKVADLEPDCMLLGHVVHILLDAKYPEAPPAARAALPEVNVRSAVVGAEGADVMRALRILLRHKRVMVVEPVDVLDFCLNKYREEAVEEDLTEEYELPREPEPGEGTLLGEIFVAEDQRLIDEAAAKQAAEKTAVSTDKKEKKDKKGKKGKAEKKAGKGKGKSGKGKDKTSSKKEKGKGKVVKEKVEEEECVTKSVINEETQTPIKIPEIIVLSQLAALGEIAYRCLVEGEPIPDEAYMRMVVCYLQHSLENKDGFALMGFPQSLYQAYIFETVTTGKEPTCGLAIGDPPEMDKRIQSSIVPNPHPRPSPSDYPTILTSYVRMRRVRSAPGAPEKPLLFPSADDKLMVFYLNQGVYYDQYYTEFDVNTLKKLAKIVIGDYSLPWKTSDELLGLTIGDPESNPLEKSPLATEKELDEKETDPASNVEEEEESMIQAPPPTAIHCPGVQDPTILSNTVLEFSVPEETEEAPATDFVAQPVNPDAMLRLADLWENLEKVYFYEMRQLWFERRRHFAALPVFLTHIRNHMRNFVTRPATDQNMVYSFQKYYNDMSADLRSDEEVQYELHCRISHLYRELLSLCDRRHQEAEAERRRMISLNWAADEMTFLTNCFLNAMQLEIDRCTDTLQMLADYYVFQYQRIPSPARLTKIEMDKMKINPSADEIDPTVASVRSEVIAILGSGVRDIDTPMFRTIEGGFNVAYEHVSRALMRAIDLLAGDPGEATARSKSSKGSKKEGKKKGKEKPDLTPILQYEEDPEVVRVRDAITREAEQAMREESERAKYRLQLLRTRALTDLDSEQRQILDLFDNISYNIIERSEMERRAVARLASGLSGAVEHQEKIQPSLLLRNGGFEVRPDLIMFPKSEQPVESPPFEESCPIEGFRVGQLGKLKDLLMGVAPSGFIPERAFVFILADLVSLIGLDVRGYSKFPRSWAKLSPTQISKLVQRLFGDVESVAWKDFILYNMELQFPTTDELLLARCKLRSMDTHLTETITREQYHQFQYWFEREKPPALAVDRLKLCLIRHLLFCLFEISSGVMNYSALLLIFCKDNDPRVGLAKAIALSIGAKVCHSEEDGRKFVECMKEKRRQQILIDEQAAALSREIYDRAVDITVQVCEGIFIKELHDPVKILRPILDFAVDRATRRRSRILRNTQARHHLPTIDEEDELEGEDGKEETAVFIDPQDVGLKYTICLEPVYKVLETTIPWAEMRPKIPTVTGLFKKLEATFKEIENHEGHVYVHEFLNTPFITDLLQKVHRFKIKYPKYIIADMFGAMPMNRYCD